MKNPDMIARSRGKDTIKQELGQFRSFASEAARSCPELDEEEFFESVARNYLKGIAMEVSGIFGAAKAKRLLDPFTK